MIRDPEVSVKHIKDKPLREGSVRWTSWNIQGAAWVKHTGVWFQLRVREDANDQSL